MTRRYCEMCDEWYGAAVRECPACGDETVKADIEPPEPDGEAFRGGEAAAYEREQMSAAQRLK
jgi:hypothetical protein